MWVSIFGAVALGTMVFTYAMERRSHWFVLVFVAASVAASAYALMIEAWPFAVLEAIWAGIAAWRWWRLAMSGGKGVSIVKR